MWQRLTHRNDWSLIKSSKMWNTGWKARGFFLINIYFIPFLCLFEHADCFTADLYRSTCCSRPPEWPRMFVHYHALFSCSFSSFFFFFGFYFLNKIQRVCVWLQTLLCCISVCVKTVGVTSLCTMGLNAAFERGQHHMQQRKEARQSKQFVPVNSSMPISD